MKTRLTPFYFVLLIVLILSTAISCNDKPVQTPHVHSWDEGTVTEAPTCTKKGVKTFKCTLCSETKTEEVVSLSHSFDTTTGKCTTCSGYKCGENVAAVYESETKTLLVIGSGDMNKNISSPAWASDDIATVVINDGVTSVSGSAFKGMTGITALSIGKDVKTIGSWAFQGCSALANLSFAPDCALEEIGDSAFSGCKALTAVSFPSNLKKIGLYAFDGAANLENVVLNQGLEEIALSAFSNTKIEKLDIPSSLNLTKSIGVWNFSSLKTLNIDSANTTGKVVDGVIYSIDGKTLIGVPSGKKDVTLPENVTAVMDYAFHSWNGNTIEIPASVKIVGEGAFMLSKVQTVTFNEGLETVSGNAFRNTNVKAVVLPSTVKNIGVYAFLSCSSLESVDIKSSSLESIGENAFSSCSKLTSIRINMPETASSLDTKGNKWGNTNTSLTVEWYGSTT